MTELQKEMRAHAQWLRDRLPAADLDVLESNVQLLDSLRRMPDDENMAERFEEIADALTYLADISFVPSRALEKRVEEQLAAVAAAWADVPPDYHALRSVQLNGLVAAIWWLGRSTNSAAGKSLLASGLGTVAATVLGSALGSTIKKEG